MSARRRIDPGRGRATGISGTRAAYDSCARPGCGDARVKHLTDGPCTAFRWLPPADAPGTNRYGPGTCTCPGFSESEE